MQLAKINREKTKAKIITALREAIKYDQVLEYEDYLDIPIIEDQLITIKVSDWISLEEFQKELKRRINVSK